MRAGQKRANTVSSSSRAAASPSPAWSQQVSNSRLTIGGSSLRPIKRAKSLAHPTGSTMQREMALLTSGWGVLWAGSCRQHQADLTVPLLPPGWHIQKQQQVERCVCGVSMVLHLLLYKQKVLQFSTGRFTPSLGAKESSWNLLQITLEPQETSPVQDLYHSPRAL